MRRHAEQVKQVGITYVTHRWVLLITLGAILLIVVPNLMLVMSGKPAADRAPALLFLIGFPAFFGTMFLVLHAKAQFAHPRARLMPGFRLPHLLVHSGFVLGLVIVYPLGIAWCAGVDPLGILALSLAIAAPYAWAAHANRMTWMLVPLAVFFSLMTDWGARWWIVDASLHTLVNSIILGSGMALLAAWVWRLSRLREEMDDYQIPFQWSASMKGGGEVPEQRRLLADHLRRHPRTAWIGDAWHARLGGYHGHHPLRLIRLLRHGVGSVPPELQAALAAVVLTAITLFYARVSYLAAAADFGPLWFPIQMALIMPGMVAGQTLASRRARVAGELLLPLSRSELINGLFATTAWYAFVMWLMFNIGGLLIVGTHLSGQITPAAVGVFLPISFALAMAAFGMIVRTSTWNSLAWRIVAMVPVSVAAVLPLVAWWMLRDRYGDAPFIVMALVLVAVGAGLVASARRAWLNLELG